MALDDNPYAAPLHPSRAPVGLRSGNEKDIRGVAVYQKGIVISILINFAIYGLNIVLGRTGIQFPLIVPLALVTFFFINLIVGGVFVLLMARKVYHPVVGLLMAVLAGIPILGLPVLLLISSRATKILQSNGYKVGLLGADLSQIPK
jgi:hypothetical protein